MSPDSAFFFSGRFIVSVTTAPSRSTVQCLVVSSSRTGMEASGRLRCKERTCSTTAPPSSSSQRGSMSGFWKFAHADPDYLAIVDPDGTEHAAGTVLARANQVVHALREVGLQPGDTVAAVLPNGSNPM